MKHLIGIVGNGYVGGATSLLCSSASIDCIIYDKDEDKCSHDNLQISDLTRCDFVFVCVPTPMNKNGSCVTMYVEMVVAELIQAGFPSERIIVKSTVPVGTCKKLGVMFMPEFLTEKNWKNDFLNQKIWILGDNERNDKLRDELYSIFETAWKDGVLRNRPHMLFSKTQEAELVKYVRNGFLAVKVSFFNEIHDFCEAKEIDYEKIVDLTTLDSRITHSHTKVPGPDGKKGFGGTCFPKDLASLKYQISVSGANPKVITSCIQRNEQIDRPERDWKENKGRSVL